MSKKSDWHPLKRGKEILVKVRIGQPAPQVVMDALQPAISIRETS